MLSATLCARTVLDSFVLADDKELLLTPESLDFSLKQLLPRMFKLPLSIFNSLAPPTTYFTDVSFWSASQISSKFFRPLAQFILFLRQGSTKLVCPWTLTYESFVFFCSSELVEFGMFGWQESSSFKFIEFFWACRTRAKISLLHCSTIESKLFLLSLKPALSLVSEPPCGEIS